MRLTELSFAPDGKTLADLFAARVAATPDSPAARYDEANLRRTLSWKEVECRANTVAAGLIECGIEAGDVVGSFLPTGCPWMLLDLACLRSGVITAAYHPGWKSEELRHALRINPPQLIVCRDADRSLVDAALATGHGDVRVVTVEALLGTGSVALPDSPPPSCHAAATIVFTSGTGGQAKAVELSHSCLLGVAWEAYHLLGFDGRGVNTLHWLPLSHMFGRIGLYVDWIAGSIGHFSRGVDRLAEDLCEVRPAVLFAVPQMLTRLRHRIETGVRAQPRRARWAFVSLRRLTALANRLPPSARLPFQAGVRRCIFPAVHAPLGGRLSLVVVGGAPVDAGDKWYFESLGIAVREGFGMTETAGVAAVQPFRARSEGAGKLLSGIQFGIGDDRELLLRGSSLLSRYLNAEAYDAAGWFHTGDIAEISRRGDLRIRGRLKDIVIPMSGENVDPAKIEALVCRHAWIEDACLIGDRRPCLVAVITLSQEGREALQGRDGPVGVAEKIKAHLAQMNAALPRYERVRGHVLASGTFNVEGGELTVTHKKRRAQIAKKYHDAIDCCYATLHTERAKLAASPPLHTDTSLSLSE